MNEGLEPVPNNLDLLGQTIRGFVGGQEVFSRYRLISILGRGGMGVVWRAQDQELNEEVAIKFLPELVRVDEVALEEMKRETRQSRKLAHPHIVKVYDFVSDESSAAIVMEYVNGANLSSWRARCPNLHFEVDDISAYIEQTCEALEYAHTKAKIVHRDIKPSHLMVTEDGELKITDFGISSSLSDCVNRLTMNRGTTGTASYMSPQKALGQMATVSDDIYSLGAVIYELLTGKPPFYTGNVIRQLETIVPPSMAERRAELGLEGQPIPQEWEAAVAACLAKEPELRPQSAKELGEILTGRALLQPRVDIAPEPTSPPVTPVAFPPIPKTKPAQPKEKEPWIPETSSYLKPPPRGASSWILPAFILISLDLFALRLGYYYLVVVPNESARLAKIFRQEQLARQNQEDAYQARAEEIEALIRARTKKQKEQPSDQALVESNWPKPGQSWTNSLGLKFVPAGTDGVLFCVYDVRVQDYQQFVSETGKEWPRPTLFGNYVQTPNDPAVDISWNDAEAFCVWLTRKEQDAGVLGPNQFYRLPKDEEWSRAVGSERYPWGDDYPPPPDAGNYCRREDGNLISKYSTFEGTDGFAYTSPVGQFQPNSYGLYDMGGNVWQWCDDWYDESIDEKNAGKFVGVEPLSDKVLRGAAWGYDNPVALLSTYRYIDSPGIVDDSIGFRVVVAVSPKPEE